ncbi:hypothetical protein BK746_04615 [Bacillus thuringiensis serovar yosoo]|uniref:DUF1304 domain-containing protein n=1 Tax=Bacillus thuringiensis serovar yosoo TaxID=180848 RepID=A0A9X6IH21_BACTU|nr:hypothetical protein BK746_04615 [Bacillus thuringiensis serovar yosoo]
MWGTYTWKQSHWLYDSIIFHHLCGVAAIFGGLTSNKSIIMKQGLLAILALLALLSVI